MCHLTLQCRASLLSCLEMRCLLQQQDAHERRAGATSWYVPTIVKGQRVGAELPGAPPSSAGMQRHPFAFHVHLQGWCRLCRQQGAARMHCLRTMMVMHSACFQGDSCHSHKPVQCVYRAGASAAPKVQCAMLAEMPGLLGVSTQSQHSLCAQQRHAHGCWVPLQTSAPGAMQRA